MGNVASRGNSMVGGGNNDGRWAKGVNGWGDAVTGDVHTHNNTWAAGWNGGGAAGAGYGGAGTGSAAYGIGMYAKSGQGMFDSYNYSGYTSATPYGGYSYASGNGALPPGATSNPSTGGPLAPATANVVPVNYAYGGYGGYGNNASGSPFGATGGYGFPNAGVGYGYGNYQAHAPGPHMGSFGGANPHNWNGDGTAPYTYGFPYGGYGGYGPGMQYPGAEAYGLSAPGYTGVGSGGVSDGTYLTSSRTTGTSNVSVR